MRKESYLLGSFGSILLLLFLISSLILDYSYTVNIYSFIFFIEILSVLFYLFFISKKFFEKKKLTPTNKLIIKFLIILLILILPFNLLWANFTLENIAMSLYGFFIDLFRHFFNYLIIIPLIFSLILIDN